MAQKPSLDDLEKKIEQQQREIDELRRELEELREADRSFELPLPKPTTPERPISVVTDGSFPGSIRIPGTKLSLAFGGYAKGDIIHSFSDIGSAAEDLFVVPAIPTRDGDDDDGDRTNVHARETRLSVDARLDSDFGPFRAYVEGDFFGNSPGETGEVLSNSETFRLRRGFGDLGNLRVGQDWSTYTNPAAYPENLDFEVPGGQNFIRQGLIRWTQPLKNGFSIAGGVENPEARILEGGAIVNPTDKLPDFVLRGRYDLKGDYDVKLQAATVFRRLSADSVDDSAFGYGLQFSGRISVPWRRKDNEKEKDNFRFEANYGDGIGRYIEDVGIAGIAAAVDPASGDLDAVDAFGVAGSFQHWWTQEIRSTVLGSYVWVDNPSFAPDDLFKRSSLVETNLVWSPVPEVDLGVELQYGEREDEDGHKGSALRLQWSAKYKFSPPQ